MCKEKLKERKRPPWPSGLRGFSLLRDVDPCECRFAANSTSDDSDFPFTERVEMKHHHIVASERANRDFSILGLHQNVSIGITDEIDRGGAIGK